MRSLRGLIICEEPELRARVEQLLLETGEVEATLVLQRYPERFEAARHLNLCRPDVALLAIDRLQDTLAFLQEVECSASKIPVIGISRLQDPRALTELMRLGMRDCIPAPLNRTKFHDAIHRIAYQFKDTIARTPSDPLVCFLPARGGAGTSTLACNVSRVMSALPDAHVLLADLDSASGLSRFLFKLTTACSLGEMTEGGHRLDAENWRKCMVTSGKLHIIHGGPVKAFHAFTPEQMRQLVEFASSHYTAICADLTGSMETYSMELMRCSRRILLVSTTEMASVHMAREKLQFLSTMDLLPRVTALLTQCHDAPAPNVPDTQAYLGVPIEGVFDFGEKKVRKSLAEGSLIDGKTNLGRQLDQFSRLLSAQLANEAVKAIH